jgi:hypothetical protein
MNAYAGITATRAAWWTAKAAAVLVPAPATAVMTWFTPRTRASSATAALVREALAPRLASAWTRLYPMLRGTDETHHVQRARVSSSDG